MLTYILYSKIPIAEVFRIICLAITCNLLVKSFTSTSQEFWTKNFCYISCLSVGSPTNELQFRLVDKCFIVLAPLGDHLGQAQWTFLWSHAKKSQLISVNNVTCQTFTKNNFAAHHVYSTKHCLENQLLLYSNN